MRPWWPALAALLLAAGCLSETKLQPLPATPTTAAGRAVAEAHGVRLVAEPNVWKGRPSHLESLVTTVRVRLENQSGRPLHISYEHFELVGGSRFSYAALSPFEVQREELAVGGSGPYWPSFGVGLGGYWGGRPGLGYPWSPLPWDDPFYHPPFHRPFWDPWWGSYYGPFYPPYGYYPPRTVEALPTRDMLRRALPEGSLEDGGTVSVFLYFQDVGERETRVTLQARLVDARTGQPFGTLSIPFRVED